MGAIAVAAAGGAGYMYWSGNRAEHKPPDTVVNAPPSAALPPSPPHDSKSPVAESAPPTSPQQVATATEVETAPKINVAKIQQELDQRLQSEGLGEIKGRVNTDGSVNLDGIVASKKQKDEVVLLALSLDGVERVNDASVKVLVPAKATTSPPPRAAIAPPVVLQPDPAKLEGDINRALRNGGVGGVTAQVGDDFSVTLKGSATSAAEKNRAFQIARQFRGVGATKDRIFVVE